MSSGEGMRPGLGGGQLAEVIAHSAPDSFGWARTMCLAKEVDVSDPMIIRSEADLIAVVPHLLGFVPEDSLVAVPAGRPGPVARIDHPHNREDREDVAQGLTQGFLGSPGPVVLIAFTDREGDARDAIDVLRQQSAGVLSITQSLCVDQGRWVNLGTGRVGVVDAEVVSRFAADAVLQGRTLPAQSRASLAEQLQNGDPAPVATHLSQARVQTRAITGDVARQMVEENWISDTVHQFLHDQVPLSDLDAARMLAGIQDTPLRDAAWLAMSQRDAHEHVALWTDLTRRAPDDVRTPAAGLLAFASWLSGDGARAWVAIDQIPDPSTYNLAQLVATALTHAVPPDSWARTAGQITATDATGPGDGPRREVLRELPPARPTPGSSSGRRAP